MEHSPYISLNLHRQIRQERSKTQPSNPATWPETWKKQYFKEYPRFEKIKLPPAHGIEIPFSAVLTKRKSSRLFNIEKEFPIQKLSDLLHWSAGIHTIDANREDAVTDVAEIHTRRFYPSGGGRYPLELYISLKNVSELSDGLYHYRPREHDLELLWTEDTQSTRDSLLYDWSKNAQVILIITAVWERNFMKYADFGYPMVCMEAGHLMQNITTVCASLDLNICPLAGFESEEMTAAMDLEYPEETALYVASIGLP